MRPEVIPFLGAALVVGLVVALLARLARMRGKRAAALGGVLAVVLGGYFLYFFRDPERSPPANPAAVVAGADGRIAAVKVLDARRFVALAQRSGLDRADLEALAPLGTAESVRISIFLSLFDVHVNRAPISGRARFLGYFPGKHHFTFQEKSSEHNQHNAIVIQGTNTCCLIHQIVGPVCRRVVYWPDHDRPVALARGERFGMMKFGSRLDMYFPLDAVEVLVRTGQSVRAGETVIARLKGEIKP